MKYKKTITLLIVGIFLIWLNALSHEFVHQVAFEEDDIGSEIKFEWGVPAYVVSKQHCKSKECVLINGINDAIQYNTMPYFLFFIVAFTIIIYILDNKK